MKIYLKLVIIFVIFQISHASSCTPAILVDQAKRIELCYDKKNDLYLSKNCKSVGECFFKKKISLKIYSNQSPGFSLCYQLGGDAFFGEIQGQKETISMCKKNGYYTDQESLLLFNK